MNADHLDLCASEGWRELLRDFILPYALNDVELGHSVLEVGPGPGMTTDLLRTRLPALTAIELDATLCASLAERLAGTNVTVINGDAAAMPFDDERFTGAVSFTMLHHVPTTSLQDRLFAEVARVLRPGAAFVASDSIASNELAALHDEDIYNPVDPSGVEARLLEAGFAAVEVQSNDFGWVARSTR